MTGYLNTITYLPHGSDHYAAFRAAVGVYGPRWAECGTDDPATWSAPTDATGGLVLWDPETFAPSRAEPPVAEDRLEPIADHVIDDLRASGLRVDVFVLATYASSGGRIVALILDEDRGSHAIAVFRLAPGGPGATEAALHRRISGCVTWAWAPTQVS